MKKSLQIIGTFILFFQISHASSAMPTFFESKADETPNICQTCYPHIIRWGGKPHCAPAAVSNSLVWLSKHGYPSLQPYVDTDSDIAQARLVDHLGEIMGTTANSGTSPSKVLTGLKLYLGANHIEYKRLAAMGWRAVPEFTENDGSMVDIDWIKEGVLGKGSVWILIGWCRFNSITNNCKIFDGHWMTVVGYGKDRAGHEDPSVLIVHDSAERSERKNYYPKLMLFERGTIDENIQAKGVFKLTGDVVIKPSADFGVIQGAYRLDL